MRRRLLVILVLLICVATQPIQAQLSPEIGYALPSGAQAGSTVELTLGGYDWTPDMQLFVHDERVKLELIGPPSAVLVPEPPYWFGFKARGPAWPLPREFKARLTVPPEIAPGLIKWQVANANGASPPESLHVGKFRDVAEEASRKGVQVLPELPLTISGQVRRIEEIDRYQFQVPKAGPVTIELIARRLNSPLHGMLKVIDPTGRVLLDLADSEGRDIIATIIAQAGVPYELRLHDLDFAGDRSYVYRLSLTAGPNVLAAYPAAGRRGEIRSVEFVGVGLETGSDKLESTKRDVTFPADPNLTAFDYVLETPFGFARPLSLRISDANETLKAATGPSMLVLDDKQRAAATGSIGSRFGTDEFTVVLVKDQKLRIAALARSIGSPLDLELTLFGPDGKPIANSDDVPGTTDPLLPFVVPADGTYRLTITDRSGAGGSRAANYRVEIEPQQEDVTLTLPTQLAIPLGTVGKLAAKVNRIDGHKSPITLKLAGLPAGITAPTELTITEGKADLPIDLTCAADAPTNASLCTVTATAQVGSQTVTRSAKVLLAVTMKPRIKLTPEGLDDVRKVHRGSTYLGPMLIERLEGYAGEVTLEMTAKQQRHRQGLSSDEFIVPADSKRVEYPIFVPEWMETTKTSRMILNAAVKVPDPKGNVRTLLQRQELRLGLLPEGALMKLSHSAGEPTLTPGAELRVPLSLSLAPELHDPIELKLVSTEPQAKQFSAEPLALVAGQKEAALVVKISNDPQLIGEHSLVLRASTRKNGWPVISETTVLLTVKPN